MRARHALGLATLLLLPLALANADEPNENLTAVGIPPVPASLVAAVASYSEYHEGIYNSWHPTKRELLIEARASNDVGQIFELKQPRGARTQLTHAPERASRAKWPRHRSDYLVFQRGTPGQAEHLYRFDTDTGAITSLTPPGKSQSWPGIWSNKGDRLVYTSSRKNEKTFDIWVVDPMDPSTERCLFEVPPQGPGRWFPTDFSPDDKELLLLHMVSNTESHLFVLDIESGKTTPVAEKDPKAKVSVGWAHFARDGKSLLVACDAGAEYRRPCRLDRATGETKLLTDAIKWDTDRFALSSDRKTLAIIANEEGTGVLHLIDADTGAEKPLKLPPGSIGSIDFHENNQELAFQLVSARCPNDTYSVNLETGAVTRWTESATAADTTMLPDAETVHWKSFDERTISGILYRPPPSFEGKRPVVVHIHGGPEQQQRLGYLGRANYLLAELGVAILYPNVRGSSGFGKTFVELDCGLKREGAIKDVGALLDWLKTRDDLDADRVLLMGTDYGGFLSLACAAEYGARVKAVIDEAGILDYAALLERTAALPGADARRLKYGDERDEATRAFLDRVAPAKNVARLKKPVFVVHGARNPRLSVDDAERFAGALREQGTTVWYLLAKDEGGGFRNRKNQEYLFCATALFVEENLILR